MEQSQPSTANSDGQSDQLAHTKQTWHRPTLIFVPIQTTAEDSGSGSDGLGRTTTS